MSYPFNLFLIRHWRELADFHQCINGIYFKQVSKVEQCSHSWISEFQNTKYCFQRRKLTDFPSNVCGSDLFDQETSVREATQSRAGGWGWCRPCHWIIMHCTHCHHPPYTLCTAAAPPSMRSTKYKRIMHCRPLSPFVLHSVHCVVCIIAADCFRFTIASIVHCRRLSDCSAECKYTLP